MNTLDRHSSAMSLLLVVFVFGVAAFVAAAGRLPEPALVQPTPALIYVLSTPVPTVQPTPDTTMQQELDALRARVAELEAERSKIDNVMLDAPAAAPQVIVQAAPAAAPTLPPQPTPAPVVQLQAVNVPEGEEPLSPALLREAQDR